MSSVYDYWQNAGKIVIFSTATQLSKVRKLLVNELLAVLF